MHVYMHVHVHVYTLAEDGVLEWFENLNMTSMLKGFVQRVSILT